MGPPKKGVEASGGVRVSHIAKPFVRIMNASISAIAEGISAVNPRRCAMMAISRYTHTDVSVNEKVIDMFLTSPLTSAP
jgi:hypothetical protein